MDILPLMGFEMILIQVSCFQTPSMIQLCIFMAVINMIIKSMPQYEPKLLIIFLVIYGLVQFSANPWNLTALRIACPTPQSHLQQHMGMMIPLGRNHL